MAGENDPGRYTRPGDIEAAFSAQLTVQQNQRTKDLVAKEKQKQGQQLKDTITQVDNLYQQKLSAEKELAERKKVLEQLKINAISPSSPGGSTITVGELANVNTQISNVNAQQAVVNQLTTSLKTAEEKKTSLAAQLMTGYNAAAKSALDTAKKSGKTTRNKSPYIGTPFGQAGGNAGPISNSGKVSDQYYYNAPMVKTAYINPRGPQTQSTESAMSGSNNPQQAATAWQSLFASKGMIQMNRDLMTSFANSSTANNTSYDDNLYGFKFLYNPKEVAMTWGLAEGSNYEGIAAGLDPFSPITPGLMYSTISFSLLLNRTNDMAWLNSNGLIAGVENPYPTFSIKPGKTLNQELSEIYKKGTMYDLEYFFKTIMGLNATYKSILNGETADKGWLQGIAVELHLGAGMRYLVRIGSLDINHSMFNERMVPILSTVNISCSRFNDIVKS